MPNGDIVTGCSDGVVRVFSAQEERWAPADQLKAYDDLVAAQALPTQEVGDVKKSDLPGPEALTQPGACSFFQTKCLAWDGTSADGVRGRVCLCVYGRVSAYGRLRL